MWSFLLFLAFRSALMQDQWRLVDQGGRVACVWGEPQLDAEARGRLQSAWVWSGVQPPERIAVDLIAQRRRLKVASTLILHVVRQERRGTPPLEVAAAPAAMWREIPEDLLPHWRVPAGGRLAIPYSAANAGVCAWSGPARGPGGWTCRLANGRHCWRRFRQRTCASR
jgi:hypothetical protein